MTDMTFQIPDDLFDGVREATTKPKYPDRPCAGRYIVRLDEVFADQTHPQDKDMDPRIFVQVGYTVLAVQRAVSGQPAHAVGDVCAQMIFRTGGSKWTPKYFKINMKEFICGINGNSIDPDAMSEEQFKDACRQLISDDQPVKGWVVTMDNSIKYRKDDLDDDGEPREGATPNVNVAWGEQLSADEIRARVDSAVIERFGLLS